VVAVAAEEADVMVFVGDADTFLADVGGCWRSMD
jgi:hypothetical protein